MKQETMAKALTKAMDYSGYRELIDELFANGKSTGESQSESYLNYTGLNIHRMNKWDKHYTVSSEARAMFHKLENRETWLVISEGWCGDAAHALPVMHKLSEVSEMVGLKIVLRDENPELMDHFLTNGNRSIPKLIRMDKNMEVSGTWGARPKAGQQVIDNLKAAGKTVAEAKEALQLWYARDRGKEIEKELIAMLAMG